jgi:transcriptional regulator with XRE-family HTH domain
MKFQDKLQIFRKEKGMSQEKLADKIGVSRQAVAKWETGQSCPDLDKIIALSDLLGVSVDSLVKDRDDENCLYQNARQLHCMDEEAIDFLIRAKKATYAGKGAESEPSRPKAHDLHYAEEPFLYIDTYLGGEKFAGEEAIWRDGAPFWSMNYIGRIMAPGFSAEFLKEALLLVPKEQPYRGPQVYRRGENQYHCVVNGEFEWFSGYEEIFRNDSKVYECIFHGGLVK